MNTTDYVLGKLINKPYKATDVDLRLINERCSPLKQLQKEDVYIHVCELANTKMDSNKIKYFKYEDLLTLQSLCIDSKLFIGYKPQEISRIFNAEIEYKETSEEAAPPPFFSLEVKFYYMRGHSISEDLETQIVGGIYKEAGLEIRYKSSVCNICGKDIRQCFHWPGRYYNEKCCYYSISNILEISSNNVSIENRS